MEEKKTFKSKVKKFVADHQMEIGVVIGVISVGTGVMVGQHIHNKRLEKEGMVELQISKEAASMLAEGTKLWTNKNGVVYGDGVISGAAKDILSDSMYAHAIDTVGETINDKQFDYVMLFGHDETKQ